jgi:cytochrome bd-type quinol oxidase subunit 2
LSGIARIATMRPGEELGFAMLFRFIALILIVLGLMLLGADVVTLLERGQEPHMRSLAEVVGLFSATGVTSLQGMIAGFAPGAVADGVASILAWPAFAVFGVMGVILALLFRERDDFGEASNSF